MLVKLNHIIGIYHGGGASIQTLPSHPESLKWVEWFTSYKPFITGGGCCWGGGRGALSNLLSTFSGHVQTFFLVLIKPDLNLKSSLSD